MKRLIVISSVCAIAGLSVVLAQAPAGGQAPAQGQGRGRGGAAAPAPAAGAPAAGQAPAAGEPAQGGGRRGGGGGRGGGAPQGPLTLNPHPDNAGKTGGTIAPDKPDARGWGWQVKAMMNPATPRPLYNIAKEALFQDKTVTSVTIGSFNPDMYCEARKHHDYIWFELQHSTLSFDEVRRMLLTCVGPGGAPMIRMRDAFESSIQQATDLGVIGIIMPTVDDAIEARDAARYSRFPPYGRRSSGGGSAGNVWGYLNTLTPPQQYRQTVDDNFLVTVMIETLMGVENAEEIAATHGVDVVILGNNDLSSFSGWGQNDLRYQDAIIKVHNAALKYGKYFGNAGAGYHPSNGTYTVSAATRFVQNGPSRDGWTSAQLRAGGAGPAGAAGAPAAGGRGRGADNTEPLPEPTIGLPGGAQPNTPGRGRGGRGQ